MHVGVEPRLFPSALTEVGIQSREFGELEINHAAAPAGPSSTRRTISMPRLITIDKSVIDQINAGNVGVANFLQRLSKLRMSAECFSQLNEAESGWPPTWVWTIQIRTAITSPICASAGTPD